MIAAQISKITWLLFFLSAFLFGIFCFFLHNHTIDFSSLQQDAHAKPSILLDCAGKQWACFELDKRSYVLLESIPSHVIDAFLITEDRNFFSHPGVSLRGIVRSLLVNVYKGKKVQGASTITQQLVRLLFLHNHKTYMRKIKEQWYAILVERQWSKEQILEAYLNNVYFGYGIYGVQAAAQRFWGIDISQVSVDQAAVLASIMKSPYKYSPIHAQNNVLQRRNMILSMMNKFGYITGSEYERLLQLPLKIQNPDQVTCAPHLKEAIRIFMERMVGKHALYTQGFVIQTTIDSAMQHAAQNSFKNHINELRKTLHDRVDGGLITMDSKTGEIRCLIGGYDFSKSKFNRALQAHRQMGSIFKIFVYAAALQQGLKFSDVEQDEPLEMVQNGMIWAPKNYNNQFIGAMTRAYALSYSNNIVAIKTMLQAGIDNVIKLAKACHITSELKPYPALALGCVDVTIMETIGAFNVVINHGNYVQPHFIKWIKNSAGEKIYKTLVMQEQVMDSAIASQVAKVLTFSIERLKKFYSNPLFDFAGLGKTGTTNDFRICWFCGATPELTTAICIAGDRNESLGHNVFSSKAAFPIWLNFHTKIAKSATNFYYDPKLQEQLINWRTGRLDTDPEQSNVVALLQ